MDYSPWSPWSHDICADKAEAQDKLARYCEDALRKRLVEADQCTLMLSGGSTPGPAYEALSRINLDWERVNVGLVDDRWVDADHAASNERLIRETLLTREAASARLLPMKTGDATPFEGQPQTEIDYAGLPRPFDVVVLGMGPDGHTASFFPHSKGLEAALDPETTAVTAAIDATGAPVAGENVLRMTLTLPVIATARHLVLMITGEEKKDVFAKAREADRFDMPIRAVLDLAPQLHIIWAP